MHNKTKTTHLFSKILLVFTLSVLVAVGCKPEESKGPGEKAGKKIDELIGQAKNSADDASEKIEGSLKTLQDKADTASKAIKEKVIEVDEVVTKKIKDLTEKTDTTDSEEPEASTMKSVE
jgi:hypothetical protein